jgi:hypothetical protein
LSPWQGADTDAAHRSFDVASWDINDGIAVDLWKAIPDGNVNLEIVFHVHGALTLDEARQAGAALIAAAAEVIVGARGTDRRRDASDSMFGAATPPF